MITTHETSFTVYPEDCNYMQAKGLPMLHGGTLLLKMDRCAAECCRRLLYSSKTANSALTVNVSGVTFFVGATLGDIIFLNAKVIKLGAKRIEVAIVGQREDSKGNRETICEGCFIFCAMVDNTKSVVHELILGNK